MKMESKVKATPGPWKMCCDKCLSVNSENHPICEIISGSWGDNYPALKLEGPSIQQTARPVMEQITYGVVDPLEAEANASLIAAAPDLLEALKQLFDALPMDIPDKKLHTAAIHAKEIIKKAEGG